jgi:hypothetical protein
MMKPPQFNPLPSDVMAVMARLNQDFCSRADFVASLLLAEDIGDRLLRCIVHAAHGEEVRVQQLIELQRQDYRDVIMAGEYDKNRRVRDLRVSFLIDTPEKMWISEVACMMASRGYVLSSVETRAATATPFLYTADYGEGSAKFVGPKGEVEIEKKDRQWIIRGDPRDLEIHEMNHVFNDEPVFRDAVSCYLLSGVASKASNEARVPANQDMRQP